MHSCCRALTDEPSSGSQRAEQAFAPYTGCVRACMPGLDPLQGISPGLSLCQLSWDALQLSILLLYILKTPGVEVSWSVPKPPQDNFQ